MTFDERIITDASPAAAFSFLGELGNVQTWDPSISHVQKVTPGPVGVGTFYRVAIRMFGTSTTLDYYVEAYEPDRRVIFMGRGMMTHVTDTVNVLPYREGSRVHWTAEIHLTTPLVLLDPVFSWFFSGKVRHAVENLKHMLNRLTPDEFTRPVMQYGEQQYGKQRMRHEEEDRPMHGEESPMQAEDLGMPGEPPRHESGEERRKDERFLHH